MYYILLFYLFYFILLFYSHLLTVSAAQTFLWDLLKPRYVRTKSLINSMPYQTHPSNICLLKTGLPWREPFFLWSTKAKAVNSHTPQILWSRGCALCTSRSLLDYYASWSSFNILISWYCHLLHWKLQGAYTFFFSLQFMSSVAITL